MQYISIFPKTPIYNGDVIKGEKGMKTSEFMERVEELGYVTDKDNWYVYVRNKRFTVAMVSETRVNAIEANLRHADIPNKLFDLIVEYAKTPLEDREEPKRYYLKQYGIQNKTDTYMEHICIKTLALKWRAS